MKDYLLAHTRKLQYFLLLGDVLVLFLSLIVSYSIRIHKSTIPITLSIILSKVTIWWVLVICIYIITFYIMDQYELQILIHFNKSIVKLISAIFTGWIISSCLLFFSPKYILGREVLVISLFIIILFIILLRWMTSQLMIQRTATKRLAIVGHGQIVSAFLEDISNIHNSGITINRVCIIGNTRYSKYILADSVSYHSTVSELLKGQDFDALAFDSTTGHFSDDDVQRIVELKFEGKEINDLSTLYENLTGKVPVTYIDGQWLLSRPELQGKVSTAYLKLKRIFDLLLSAMLLIITSPLFLLITIFIKLDSLGSIFFIQERLGYNRKPFKCYKFRSMVEGAETASEPIWTTEDDPRVTKLGRFLRRTRLDELPQLWNILKGDMTFVGPRPIRDHFARKLAREIPFYGLRFCVKPGLTGWAQVNYDYAGSEIGQLEKFQYELFYVRNMSLFLDLLTLFKTMKTVIKRKGL